MVGVGIRLAPFPRTQHFAQAAHFCPDVRAIEVGRSHLREKGVREIDPRGRVPIRLLGPEDRAM
jgi:hypothetical protein